MQCDKGGKGCSDDPHARMVASAQCARASAARPKPALCKNMCQGGNYWYTVLFNNHCVQFLTNINAQKLTTTCRWLVRVRRCQQHGPPPRATPAAWQGTAGRVGRPATGRGTRSAAWARAAHRAGRRAARAVPRPLATPNGDVTHANDVAEAAMDAHTRSRWEVYVPGCPAGWLGGGATAPTALRRRASFR